MQKAIREQLLATLDVKLKDINELSKQIHSLQKMTNDRFPRDQKLWDSVTKASSGKRADLKQFTEQAIQRKIKTPAIYDIFIKGTFEERVALMLMQVLEIAAEHDVDLEWMIHAIENHRLNGKH